MIHALTIAVTSLALAADPAPVNWPPMPKEGKHVDYIKWYDNVRRAGLKPEDDAYPIYKEIFPTLDSTDPNAKRPDEFRFEGHRSDDKTNTELGPWDPKDHPEWEAAYQRTQPAVRKFKRAAAMPGYFRPTRFSPEAEKIGKVLLFVTLPDLMEFRIYSKGLSDAAWRAPGGRVDGKLFLESISARLGEARQLEQSPLTISQLVAIAVRITVYEDVLYAIKFDFLSGKQLAKLQTDLERLDSPLPPTAHCLTGEFACFLDMIQYADSHDGKIDDPLIGPLAAAYRESDAGLSDSAQHGREYFESLAALYAEPGLPNDKSRRRLAKRADELHKSDRVLRLFAPNLDRANELRLRVESWRSAMRLLLAINAYKHEHQNWPESLDDLPTNFGEFKRDPVSNKPFVYRLVDGEPLLYSLGVNQKDDGGVHDGRFGEQTPDTDFVFWPPQKVTSLFRSAPPTKPAPVHKKGKKAAQQTD